MEVHGRYFEDSLLRFLAQVRPEIRTKWLECVAQAMEAPNSLIFKYGCSPSQIATGRDPELAGDLLQDLPDVISSSSVLHDHTARVRSIARRAVLQNNDNPHAVCWSRDRDHAATSPLVTKWPYGDEVRARRHRASNDLHSGEVQESSWGYVAKTSWPCLEVLSGLHWSNCGTEQTR